MSQLFNLKRSVVRLRFCLPNVTLFLHCAFTLGSWCNPQVAPAPTHTPFEKIFANWNGPQTSARTARPAAAASSPRPAGAAATTSSAACAGPPSSAWATRGFGTAGTTLPASLSAPGLAGDRAIPKCLLRQARGKASLQAPARGRSRAACPGIPDNTPPRRQPHSRLKRRSAAEVSGRSPTLRSRVCTTLAALRVGLEMPLLILGCPPGGS